MDTTDQYIMFNDKGICNHCSDAIKKLDELRFENVFTKQKTLVEIVEKIKSEGKGKIYDCIIGLSGGVDSSYLAYIVVKEFGLRPLAVHVDNGWDSELAVQNIENIVKKLNIDLYTWVIDWEEFKDLQRAYLKASVIDIEVLSDNAIVIAIHKLLKKNNLRYFLIGYNHNAESIMPSSWLFSPKYDSLNIRSIYNKFGTGYKLKTYPLLNLFGYIQYKYFDRSRSINILDLVPYEKEKAIQILKKELNWRDYGGKHHESKITQFYQAFILPNKFGIDKRRAHFSSLIVSGQLSRNEALKELEKPIYDSQKLVDDQEYFLKKLGFTKDEFTAIMNSQPISHFSYSSYNKLFTELGKVIKIILVRITKSKR